LKSLKKEFTITSNDAINKLELEDLEKLENKLEQTLKIVRATKSERVSERNMCRICEERERKCVFLPCGHYCTCLECSEKIDTCPLCRANILQKVKTFN